MVGRGQPEECSHRVVGLGELVRVHRLAVAPHVLILGSALRWRVTSQQSLQIGRALVLRGLLRSTPQRLQTFPTGLSSSPTRVAKMLTAPSP